MTNPSVKSGGYSFRNGKKPDGPKKLTGIMASESANGGYIAEHHFDNSNGPYVKPEANTFGPKDGQKLLAHISEHLGIKSGEK